MIFYYMEQGFMFNGRFIPVSSFKATVNDTDKEIEWSKNAIINEFQGYNKLGSFESNLPKKGICEYNV